MPADTQITDPALLSVLETASQVREQCAQILSLIQQLTTAPSVDDSLDPTALWASQRTLTTQLALLRGQNRGAVQGVRATKARTAEARHEVDSLHLKLQNLYYEQRHLKGEIVGCRDYEHRYLRLPMVSVEEFLQRRPEHADSAEHELTIARIEDEHAARVGLEEGRERLVRKREGLVKETALKKEELARLDTEIEKWVAAQSGPRKLFDDRQRKITEAREKKET